jgi:endonuclease YncB( thermonuclease family)
MTARGLCRLAAAAALLCWVAVCGAADEWIEGRVVSVTDGDTAVVATAAGRSLRVRFYGVDAPERANRDWPAQAHSRAAHAFMRELIAGRTVRVRLNGDRTHAREVGEIFVNGRSASREIVGAGLAWWNEKFAPNDRELARLQQAARAARRGLWRDDKPVPPWVHRRLHRSGRGH